ncbi:Hypothetical predicted protein, partial [Mytilus galloprovincialis]
MQLIISAISYLGAGDYTCAQSLDCNSLDAVDIKSALSYLGTEDSDTRQKRNLVITLRNHDRTRDKLYFHTTIQCSNMCHWQQFPVWVQYWCSQQPSR